MATGNVLLLLRRSPYDGAWLAEALDAALVAAAFDQRVAVLFLEDAVFALLPDQHGETLGVRSPGKIVQALADYEIDRVYVCSTSLANRRIRPDSLVISAEPLDTVAQGRLIANHGMVWND
ncbi:MAG: DsrE family protein [Pseudomonadales bacterium]